MIAPLRAPHVPGTVLVLAIGTVLGTPPLLAGTTPGPHLDRPPHAAAQPSGSRDTAEPPHDEHDEHADEHDHDEGHAAAAAGPSVALLEQFGVTLATAGPGVVDPGLELPGEIRTDATRTTHVSPRFAGTVRAVHAQPGDRVRAGQVLAVIESQALATYELRAPFDGTVVSRLVTMGETADPASAAFVIADLSTVWAEVSVYQKHLDQVRPGQRVRITAGYEMAETETTITYVAPVLSEPTRTATARAVIPNPDGIWRPGMFVTATVLDPVHVAVAVPTTALQRLDGRTVVFVAEDGHFRAQPVRLGRTGLRIAEIAAGLSPGTQYAATGSYLVKAELEKAAVEDPHGH